MSMQATRVSQVEATSGTFETERPHDVVVQAHQLACEIERLLTPAADDAEPYGRRLARALARSLIDQLADLSRDQDRTKLA